MVYKHNLSEVHVASQQATILCQVSNSYKLHIFLFLVCVREVRGSSWKHLDYLIQIEFLKTQNYWPHWSSLMFSLLIKWIILPSVLPVIDCEMTYSLSLRMQQYRYIEGKQFSSFADLHLLFYWYIEVFSQFEKFFDLEFELKKCYRWSKNNKKYLRFIKCSLSLFLPLYMQGKTVST